MYQRLALTILSPIALLSIAGCVSTQSADRTLELTVGETKHITAYRADGCGTPAPSFASIQGRLPRSELVTYSDGGLSSRVSNQCGTRVPTRAVNATAVKAGSEFKRYQSGTVAIVVR